MDFSSQVLYSKEKKKTRVTAKTNLEFAGVCLRWGYGEKIWKWVADASCITLDLLEAESLRYQASKPALSNISAGKTNKQNLLDFTSPSSNISSFFGGQTYAGSQARILTWIFQEKQVVFHSTGCKQVPAVAVTAAQTESLWQKHVMFMVMPVQEKSNYWMVSVRDLPSLQPNSQCPTENGKWRCTI